jgi:hypothetical protein
MYLHGIDCDVQGGRSQEAFFEKPRRVHHARKKQSSCKIEKGIDAAGESRAGQNKSGHQNLPLDQA